MRQSTLRRLALCAGLFAAAAPARAETLLSLRDAVKSMLPDAKKLSKASYTATAEQTATLRRHTGWAPSRAWTYYTGRSAEGASVGRLVMVDQEGKEGPMRLAFVMDEAGNIKDVAVASYVEERGKPVKERFFLDQFRDIAAGDKIEVGVDIQAVTGATSSSMAVCEAARRTIAFTKVVVLGSGNERAQSAPSK